MANNQNTTSTILSEHRRIVGTRYVLAIFNFIAVLLGMLVTLFFVSRRGIYDAVLTVIWVLIVINAIQIALCLGEYILRAGFGINLKFLPVVSYAVGFLWVLALVLEMVLATIEAGTLRTDLLIVAIIQAVVAIVAYILWPNLDRRAIDSMIKPSSRGDEKKRAKKAKRYVATYGFLTVLIVLAQAATLLLYKMPPTFYDIFADNRALAYELNEDKDGYIVSAVYNGTSPYVNIPATYNNLPVVGIKSGALVDDGIIEKYKITSITFGTPEKDENGNEVLKSNLQFINSGAIACSRVESLSIPESVTAIEDGAIRGDAIRTIEYSSRANFDYAIIAGCPNLARVLMSGEHVGVIASLEGMPERVNIQVDKDIYNAYRESNLNYVSSFSPILADDEFCIDFFTGCDYYIDSIFAKKGETVKLTYASLKNDKVTGVAPSVDTLAYIRDAHELGTDGAKADSAFRGWYYDGNYVAKVDFTEQGEISLTESVKIYAKWVNEYNATLNWGSHKPDGQVDKIYWTEEDIRSFPVVSDRAGYSAGVVWTKAGTTEQVATSAGITESIALNATWQFDAPTISISSIGTNVEEGAINLTGATFVYDEIKRLTLSAVKSHPLESATGIPQDKKVVAYGYEWYHNGVKLANNAANLSLENVPESGTYTLRVIAQSPYNSEERSYADVFYDVQITKKPLDLGTVVLNNLPDLTYDGLLQSVNYSGSLPVHTTNVQPTFTYTKNGYTSNAGVKDAGNYTVTLTFEKSDPNEAANYATATLTTALKVNPRVLEVEGWTQDTFVYAKTERSIEIRFNNVVPGDDLGIVYENNRFTDADDYTAKVTGVTNENYNLLGTPTKDWTITPKPVTVQSWKLNGSEMTSVTYTGAEHSVEAVISGVMQGDTHVRFSYEGSTMAATNVGTYVAEVTGVNDSNYTFDDTAEFEWAITPARLTVTFDSHGNPTYNGGAQGIYATVSGIVAADVSAFDADDFDTEGTTASVSLAAGENANSLKLAFSATNAATYEAKINGLLSGGQHLANYVIDTAAEDSFSITPKLLNVRPVDGVYTYNGQEQHMLLMVEGVVAKDKDSITFTIGEGGDKVDDVTHGVFIDYVGKDAGSYSTSVTAVNDSNYSIIPYSQPLTINRQVITIANWTMTNGTTNEPVAWGEGAFTYNQKPYTVGYELQGVIGSENVTLALADASNTAANIIGNPNYRTVATLADDTDGYDVNKNYSFEQTSIEWRINPQSITLTWTVDDGVAASVMYSKSEHTAAYTAHGLITGDSLNVTYADENMLKAVNRGAYDITVTSIGNTNYKLDGGASFSWSITPKPITVGWRIDELDTDITSVVYKAGNYTVNPEFDGLIDDDSTSVNYDVAKNQHTRRDAGNYTVLATGLSNANYTIAGGSSEFNWTITRLPVEIEWFYDDPDIVSTEFSFTYNGDYQRPSAKISNKLGSDSFVITYSGEGKNARNNYYTVEVINLGNNNYTLNGATGVTQAYTIEKLPVSISWASNREFTYNAQNQYPVATITNRCFGDEITITYDGTASDAGNDYTVSISAIDNENYTLTDADGDLSCDYVIKQRPVTLSWEYSSIVYNAGVQYPRATVISNVYGQTVNVDSYDGDVLVAKNVGSYSVEAKTLSNANFTFDGYSNVSHEYSIEKRVLGYEWYGVKDGDEVSLDNLVYDGKRVDVLVRFNNVCDYDITMISPNYAIGSNTRIDAGSVVPVVTIKGDVADNYKFNSGDSISETFIIAKQPVTITWGENTEVFYNKLGQKLGYSVKGSIDGTAVTPILTVNGYSANENDTYENADTYRYVISIAEDSNYTLVNCTGDSFKDFVIKPCLVTVNWSEHTFTYDGTMKEVKIDSVVANSLAISNIQLSQSTMIAAGRQTVTATSMDSNYTIANPTVEFVINPRRVQITSWDKSVFTYDGKPHSTKANIEIIKEAGEGEISLAPTLNYTNNSITDYGSKEVTVALDSSNYVFVDGTIATQHLTVNQREVRITGWNQSTFTYDGNEHSTSVNIEIVRLDGEGELYLNPQLTYINNFITNVSDYAKARVQLDSNNYKFVDGDEIEHELKVNPAVVTITNWSSGSFVYDGYQKNIIAYVQVVGAPMPQLRYKNNTLTNVLLDDDGNVVGITAEVELVSGNYVFAVGSQTTATLKITPKTVYINSWSSQKVTYNGQEQRITANVNDVNAQQTLTYANNVLTDVGTTTATVFVGSNYVFADDEVTTHTFEVEQRELGISWMLPYDSYEFRESGYVFGAVPTNVAGYDRISFEFADGTSRYDVYEYTIKIEGISGDKSGNYKLPANCEKTYTITPQRVSITWLNTTYTYDGNEHAPVVEITGAVDNNVDVSYVAFATQTNAATYNYTVVLSDSNYTLAGCNGNASATMVINPAKVTVSWPTDNTVVYDGLRHTIKPIVMGVSGQIDDSKITVSSADCVDAGIHLITITGIDDTNYTINGVDNRTGHITISARPVTILWQNLNQTYGKMSSDIKFAVLQDVVSEDDVDVVVEGFYTTLGAGSHILTAKTELVGDKKDNYVVSDNARTTNTLIVGKQTVIATWTDTTAIYDGEAHAPTLVIKNANGEDLLTNSVTTKIDQGTYTYRASDFFTDTANYELLENTLCMFIVEKKEVRINDFEVSYDSVGKRFVITLNDVLEQDRSLASVSFTLTLGDKTISNSNITEAGTYTITFARSNVYVGGYNYKISDVGTVTIEVTLDASGNII
ncbi:MAG: hypothetical protein IJW66_01125 [Clostridia bacterium]|nr:hypothetical protein [Clostridia bacterium]